MARPKKETVTHVTPAVAELIAEGRVEMPEQAEAAPEARVTRATRVPVAGPRDILTVTFKDPNYFYRWVKDFPGRLQRFEAAGYTVVVDENVRVGQRTVDSNSRLGSAVTRLDGPNTLVLMRIPLEWYNEDQEAKQRVLDAQEDALKGEGLTTSRKDVWQPGEGEYAGRKAR